MTGPCGEDVGNVDPWQWTPSHRVEADIDVQHRSHGLGRRRGIGSSKPRVCDRWRVSLEDGADDKEEGSHSKCRNDEREPTTERLDTEEDEDGCCDDLDDTIHTAGKEGVLPVGVSNGCEDLGRIVVDGVLASPLLQEEDEEGDEKTDEVALAEECLFPVQPRARFPLLLDGSLNLGHLSDGVLIGFGGAAEISKDPKTFIVPSYGCEPPRRFL